MLFRSVGGSEWGIRGIRGEIGHRNATEEYIHPVSLEADMWYFGRSGGHENAGSLFRENNSTCRYSIRRTQGGILLARDKEK